VDEFAGCAFPILRSALGKVALHAATRRTNARAHARAGATRCRAALLSARAYFVGSGPGHYFEIHEVEWRNRVKANFGAEGREGSYRWMEQSGPVEVTFVACGTKRPEEGKKRGATPRRVQAQSLFCMNRRRECGVSIFEYLLARSWKLNLIGGRQFYIDVERSRESASSGRRFFAHLHNKREFARVMATTSIILGTKLPSAISPTSKWQMDGSCRPLSVNFPERSVYFASLVIDYLGRNRGGSLGEIARSLARSRSPKRMKITGRFQCAMRCRNNETKSLQARMLLVRVSARAIIIDLSITRSIDENAPAAFSRPQDANETPASCAR